MPVLSSMFPGFEFSSSKQTDTVGARRVRKGRASGVPVKSPINGTFSSSRDSYVPIVIPANITHSAFSSRQSVARRRSKTKKNSTFMFFKPRSKDVIEIPSRLTRSPEEQVEIKPSVEILTAEKEGHLHIMIDKDQPPVPLSARSEMAQGQLTPPVTPPHKRLPALPDVQDEGDKLEYPFKIQPLQPKKSFGHLRGLSVLSATPPPIPQPGHQYQKSVDSNNGISILTPGLPSSPAPTNPPIVASLNPAPAIGDNDLMILPPTTYSRPPSRTTNTPDRKMSTTPPLLKSINTTPEVKMTNGITNSPQDFRMASTPPEIKMMYTPPEPKGMYTPEPRTRSNSPPPKRLTNSPPPLKTAFNRPDSRSTQNSPPSSRPMHSRTPSRLGSESSHQSPFERALYKMQHAGNKITCRRLSEEWDDLHDEQSFQEIQFEKRLWALTAYQWFTNGKQLQSPLHEILTEGRTAGRVLHLHGSQADGWFLAARYPRATIYTVSSSNTTSPPTDWPSPPNHHCLYLPTASFTIPFADNYFDFVVSKTLPKLVHNDQWTSVFQDCMRILKPGGWMEISTLDPHFARQGPTLAEWVNTHIERRLDESGFSTRPSEDVLKTMEDVGLTNLRRAKIALPVSLPLSASRPNVNFQNRQTMQTTFEDPDARRLMVYLGRHFYQDLYSQCLTPQESKHWFWNNKSIRTEFEGLQTGSLLTIACAQKSDGVSH